MQRVTFIRNSIAGLLVFVFSFLLSNSLIERDRARDARLAESELAVGNLSQSIKILSQSVSTLEARIAGENALVTNKVSTLEKKVTATATVNEAVSLWRPRAARLSCIFPNSTQGVGSGVLVPLNGENGVTIGVVSNKHVLTSILGQPATFCTVLLPGFGETLTVFSNKKEIMISNSGFDFGTIYFSEASERLRSLAHNAVSFCPERASVGDPVVIIGYPSIGVSQDVTVTEGIISGFENNYYITSAKVEQGNSGGIAVNLKGNCFLGIPTFVKRGGLESLARILDARVLGL